MWIRLITMTGEVYVSAVVGEPMVSPVVVQWGNRVFARDPWDLTDRDPPYVEVQPYAVADIWPLATITSVPAGAGPVWMD